MEDQAAQDARVEKLWKDLDTQNEGQLNLNGLKKGLSKLNHRGYKPHSIRELSDQRTALKNADSLLRDVLKAVDTNRDGHIQYSGAFGGVRQAQAWLRETPRIPEICRGDRKRALAAVQEH